MRYTTIIDIRDLPGVYKNLNARLVYLHLVLRSGYHDNDRDLCDISIRRLALETHLTISATRHALHVLETHGLIKRNGVYWYVKKWILETTITARPKSEKKAKAAEIEARLKQEKDEKEAREKDARRKELELRRNTGKTSFMLLYEDWQRKAAMGDQEAAESVKRNQKFYEQQLEFMKNEKTR